MKIPKRREFQQIAVNLLSDFDFKDFIKLCRKCTKKHSIFVIDTTLLSYNPLRFRKNLLEEE